MNYIDSSKNLLLKLQNEEKRNTATLHMTANENVMSRTARSFLSSNLSYRYYSDTYAKEDDLTDVKYYTVGQAMYRGLPAVYEFELLARGAANKMFNANFSDFCPLSGMNAVICILTTITKPGDKVFIFTPESLGHHSTKIVLQNIGREVLFIPWDNEKLCIDIERFAKEFSKNNDATIFLDLGTTFYPLPLKKIRQIVGTKTKVIYDGSHVLGLIAGGQFQNPLQEGCDILIGNTHKTFPGPQKAMMLYKDEDLGRRIASELFRSVVSSQHTHHALALYVTIMEMAAHGKLYAEQIVKNADAFSRELISQGFDIITRKEQLPVSHMVGIKGGFPRDNQSSAVLLYKADISCNTKKIFGDNSIRIGVQELTRRGMKEEEMMSIARFFKRIIIDEDTSTALEIQELNNRFNKVIYSLDSEYQQYVKR